MKTLSKILNFLMHPIQTLRSIFSGATPHSKELESYYNQRTHYQQTIDDPKAKTAEKNEAQNQIDLINNQIRELDGDAPEATEKDINDKETPTGYNEEIERLEGEEIAQTEEQMLKKDNDLTPDDEPTKSNLEEPIDIAATDNDGTGLETENTASDIAGSIENQKEPSDAIENAEDKVQTADDYNEAITADNYEEKDKPNIDIPKAS